MLNFLKYVLATVVGLMLFFFVFVFMLVGIGSVFSSASETVTVKENSILRLDLTQRINEVAEDNPFADLGGPFAGNSNVLGLKDIKDVIRKAAADDKIKGIYLQSGSSSAGWATLEEIRNELISFKNSGKQIYAYSEYYTEKGYYLASVADHIFLNPAGEFEWNGFVSEYEFYKGTFDKLDIKPLVFKVGEFKSAVEPFIRTNMSEESKLQTSALINGLYTHYLTNIAESRKLPVEKLRHYSDSLLIYNPQSALNNQLVSEVGYEDDFENEIRKGLGMDSAKKINYISYGKYLDAPQVKKTEGDANKRVAVLVAEGEIISGSNESGYITSEKFVKDLRKLRDDDKVKAIVIRINSPGGSSLASDVMWNDIKKAAGKKPVIASMSDVAASGGYYMAMACDTIVAQPNTITGSIGIFGLMFNIEDFMSKKIGVTFDRVTTSAHADWPTITHEMTDFEKSRIQKYVDEGYENFTAKAAEGRKMPVEKLKELAKGRVWSGNEAKENGLVDILGGLDDAVEVAANAANLEKGDYRVRYYPAKKDMLEDIINKLTGNIEEKALQNKLGELTQYASLYQKLVNMRGLQTRLPFEFNIH